MSVALRCPIVFAAHHGHCRSAPESERRGLGSALAAGALAVSRRSGVCPNTLHRRLPLGCLLERANWQVAAAPEDRQVER